MEMLAYIASAAAALSGAYVAYQRGRRVQRRVLVDLAASVDQRTERLLTRLDEQLGRLEAQNVEQRRRIREQAEQLEEAHRLLRRMREGVYRLIRELRKHDAEGATRLERELRDVDRKDPHQQGPRRDEPPPPLESDDINGRES
jgi:hypothetical protein